MPPVESPIRFDSDGRELAGIVHTPEGPAQCAVVIVHPFAEEKKFSHRVLVELARELASRGVATLRFDLSGEGDSSGKSEDATLSAWIEDIAAAREELARRVEGKPVGLMGLRLGATLALASAAAEMGTVPQQPRGQSPFLLLWEPILSGAKYIDEILRRRMIKEMMTTGRKATGRDAVLAEIDSDGFLDLDGLAVGRQLLTDIGSLDANALAGAFTGRALLVQIAFNAKVSAALESLAAALRAAGATAETRGIKEQVIWDRVELVEAKELIAATAAWISET
jgi:uncharacterized protein